MQVWVVDVALIFMISVEYPAHSLMTLIKPIFEARFIEVSTSIV